MIGRHINLWMEKVSKVIPTALGVVETQPFGTQAGIFTVVRQRPLSIWSNYCGMYPVK